VTCSREKEKRFGDIFTLSQRNYMVIAFIFRARHDLENAAGRKKRRRRMVD
jgi:hypothetical protein